jgi:hypothetical protein
MKHHFNKDRYLVKIAAWSESGSIIGQVAWHGVTDDPIQVARNLWKDEFVGNVKKAQIILNNEVLWNYP